jgi:hypothetical protein
MRRYVAHANRRLQANEQATAQAVQQQAQATA